MSYMRTFNPATDDPNNVGLARQQQMAQLGNTLSPGRMQHDSSPEALGQMAPTGNEGSAWGALKDAFLYSSDREAHKARLAAAQQVNTPQPQGSAQQVAQQAAGAQTQQLYGPPQQAQLTKRESNAQLPQGGMPPGMTLGGNQTRETYNTISGAGGRDLTDRYNQLAGLNTPNYGDPRPVAGYGGQAPQPGGQGSIGAAGFQSQLNNIRALRADVEAAFNDKQAYRDQQHALSNFQEMQKSYLEQQADLARRLEDASKIHGRARRNSALQALGEERAMLLANMQGFNQLQNTALQGQNQMAAYGLQGQNQLANTQLQGQNQLAAYGLQGQNQLANTQLQGQNQLAGYGLQGMNQMAVEQMRQNSPFAQAQAGLYQAQAANQWKQFEAEPQDPWSTPDGARATADFISATQGMTPQQIAQAQMAARGPQPQIVTYKGRQYVRGPNGEPIPYNPQGAQ